MSIASNLLGMPPPPSFVNRYHLAARLGTGCSGVVFSAFDRKTGEPVAIKLARRKRGLRWSLLCRTFANEAEMLKRCVHPNVIGLRCLLTGPDEVALALELVSGGDAQQLLQRHGALSEPVACAITCQVAHALEHIHACGVLHRDVKLENLLIASIDGPRVLLCDFGHACDCGAAAAEEPTAPPFSGTTGYAAPEAAE